MDQNHYLKDFFISCCLAELPDEDDVHHMTNVWQRRSHVPSHVFDVIDSFPSYAHPMTMFVAAVMALQTEGQFCKGICKRIK